METVASESHVVLVAEGGILQVRMNRPDKKNALTAAMYTQLREALQAAEADPHVRVIYLTGTEADFSSGNDLQDFAKNPATSLDAPVFHFLQTLNALQKPIVAAVSGAAVGIGTTLLLHCDLVYCDETARFQLPFASLGLCPEGGSSLLLPRLAGYHKAAELLMLGKPFDAATAREIGLVNEVLAHEALQASALQRARELVAQPAAALRLTKALLKRGTQTLLEDVLSDEGRHFLARLQSPEAKEAFTAFAQKRKPDFSAFE